MKVPHVWLLVVAGAALAAAVVEAGRRALVDLVVPLQLVDRWWADSPIPGSVEGRGALDTTVQMAVADAPVWLRIATGVSRCSSGSPSRWVRGRWPAWSGPWPPGAPTRKGTRSG